MKLTNNLFALLIALTALLLTGCNKNKGNNDGDNADYAAAIAGTYTGDCKLKDEIIASGVEVNIEGVDNKKVTLKITQDLNIMGMKIPLKDVSSSDCEVTSGGNKYSVKGEIKVNVTNVPNPLNPEQTMDVLPLILTITGDIVGDAATLTFNPALDNGIAPIPLGDVIGTVQFTGTKK
ncbi:MAG: hypothetical protein LBV41_10455 [Cytophagaceae bacterium]|nr:hypothetical protein [Cytophagaceae bacterium]